jgi:hypothetical protein
VIDGRSAADARATSTIHPAALDLRCLGSCLCCRLGYGDAEEVLYRGNTSHISTGALLLYTDMM